jgi:hypothetical protein
MIMLLMAALLETSYAVPVPQDLAAYAQFQLEHARYRLESDGQARIQYRLPPELDGAAPQEFSLRSTDVVSDQTTTLSGANVTAQCEPLGYEQVRCVMKYEHLALHGDAAAFVAVAYQKPADQAAYGQPIGILIMDVERR